MRLMKGRKGKKKETAISNRSGTRDRENGLMGSSHKELRVVVAHRGSREHFLAARAFQRQGILSGLLVDWYAPSPTMLRKVISIGGSRRCNAAMAAHSCEIPYRLVHAMRLKSLIWKLKERSAMRQGSPYDVFAHTDSAFSRAVARSELPFHNVFFGYSYASLEALEEERSRGSFTVLDQIDGGALEFRLVADEKLLHPEVAEPSMPFPAANFERARREWELADMIIVNSEWSRKAIIVEGAVPEKIEVLPLAYDPGEIEQREEDRWRKAAVGPLKVLFLGQVNVRKGIFYLIETARLLEREKVHFDIVGQIGIRTATIASAPSNMTFHGPISRDRVGDWYRQSDVFVIPTLSDGFAITQLEALAHGVPVITTPNCGDVIDNGKTGFVVPARDSQALTDAILRFIRNPRLASEMAPACFSALKSFSIDRYSSRLVSLIRAHMNSSLADPKRVY
jgi:hypothetical protein